MKKKNRFSTYHAFQLISQILTCILSYTVEVVVFSRHQSIFLRTTKYPVGRVAQPV
jgi:hypothetical protein